MTSLSVMLPLGVVVIALLYPILVYVPVAAFTPPWQMYHNYNGRKYLAVGRAHRELGPVVRLGPHHVSFSSPKAFRDIYGHGTSVVKDVLYDNQAGGNPSMADATDKQVHRGKRKKPGVCVCGQANHDRGAARDGAGPEAAPRAIHAKSQGGRVSAHDRFSALPVDQQNGGGGCAFDVRPWLNMFSYDAITSLFWSQTYGFFLGPRRRRLHGSAGRRHTGDGPRHAGLPRGRGVQRAPRPPGALPARSLQEAPAGPDGPRPVRRQLDGHGAPSPRRPLPMFMHEIVAEGAVMLNAGNDTTQSALTNALCDLAAHPSRPGPYLRAPASTRRSAWARRRAWDAIWRTWS